MCCKGLRWHAAPHPKLALAHKARPQRVKVLKRVLEADAAVRHRANEAGQHFVGALVGQGPPLLLLLSRAVGRRRMRLGLLLVERGRAGRARDGEEGRVLAVVVQGAVVAVRVPVAVHVRHRVALGEDFALAIGQTGAREAAGQLALELLAGHAAQVAGVKVAEKLLHHHPARLYKGAAAAQNVVHHLARHGSLQDARGTRQSARTALLCGVDRIQGACVGPGGCVPTRGGPGPGCNRAHLAALQRVPQLRIGQRVPRRRVRVILQALLYKDWAGRGPER